MRTQKITWKQLEELLEDDDKLMKGERVEQVTLVKPRELLITSTDEKRDERK